MEQPAIPTQDTIEAIVLATIAALPEPFAQSLAEANLEIVVAAEPSLEQRKAVNLAHGHELYGLYEGIPRPSRGQGYSLVPPDQITIFSAILLRHFPDPVALERQVRRTVLHELAHYFGISDARLHELGAY